LYVIIDELKRVSELEIPVIVISQTRYRFLIMLSGWIIVMSYFQITYY